MYIYLKTVQDSSVDLHKSSIFPQGQKATTIQSQTLCNLL